MYLVWLITNLLYFTKSSGKCLKLLRNVLALLFLASSWQKIKFVHETESRVFFSVFTFSFQRLNGLFFFQRPKIVPWKSELAVRTVCHFGCIILFKLAGQFFPLNLTLPFLRLQMTVLPVPLNYLCSFLYVTRKRRKLNLMYCHKWISWTMKCNSLCTWPIQIAVYCWD